MRTVRLVAVTIATALLVVGACGSGGPSPTEVVARSSAATTATGSSRLAMTIASSGAGTNGKTVTIKADGLFDYRAHKGTMTMDLSGLGVPGVSGNADLVLLPGVFYMRLPQLAAQPGGKPWVKIDLATVASQAGLPVGGLDQLGGNDPTAGLSYLRGATSDVKRIGADTVRGVATTHFKGTVDLDEAIDKAPADQRETMRQTIAKLKGDKTLPVDVWVDGDDHVRKMVSHLGAGGVDTVLTVELFDFGVAVAAVPPPDDQVAVLPASGG